MTNTEWNPSQWELERELDQLGVADDVRRFCEFSDNGLWVVLRLPDWIEPITIDQVLRAVSAGVHLRLPVDFEDFDLSVLQPVISELRGLSLNSSANRLRGWEVLERATGLEELTILGMDLPVDLPFERLARLTLANLSGANARRVGSAPNLRALAIQRCPKLETVQASIVELYVGEPTIDGLDFLADPAALEFLRVVQARSFDLAATTAAVRLVEVELILCKRIERLASLSGRDLDVLEIVDAVEIESAADLAAINSAKLSVYPNRWIAEPLLSELRARDGWHISDYLPVTRNRSHPASGLPITADLESITDGGVDRVSFAPFEVREPPGSGGKWEFALQDAGAPTERLSAVGEVGFYELDRAIQKFVRAADPKLSRQLVFDTEAGQFVVMASTKAAIDAVARLVLGAWVSHDDKWLSDDRRADRRQQ